MNDEFDMCVCRYGSDSDHAALGEASNFDCKSSKPALQSGGAPIRPVYRQIVADSIPTRSPSRGKLARHIRQYSAPAELRTEGIHAGSKQIQAAKKEKKRSLIQLGLPVSNSFAANIPSEATPVQCSSSGNGT
jgi:hypothetical protein